MNPPEPSSVTRLTLMSRTVWGRMPAGLLFPFKAINIGGLFKLADLAQEKKKQILYVKSYIKSTQSQ